VHILPILGYFFAGCSVLIALYVFGFAVAGWCIQAPKEELREPRRLFRFLVFIPAHNEADGIQTTIESVHQLRYPRELFKIVTIADNCDDDTAKIAASCGSQVWVREDREKRGKGQALTWAFHRARYEPFDLAMILDADATVDPEFLNRICIAAEAAGSNLAKMVFQGRGQFIPTSAERGWFEVFTDASKAAENSFVYRPRSAVGLVNLLQGLGFCLPREIIDTVPFASSSIVEDADYAIELALAGVQVNFVEDARVFSRMTKTLRDAAPQRRRWAAGIFQLMLRSVPKLIVHGVKQKRWKLVEAAFSLLFASRLFLVYLTLTATVFAVLQLPNKTGVRILSLVLATILLQLLYLWMMFRKAAEKSYSMRGLLFMPAYIGMIGLSQAAALVGIRGKRWTRTVR
jgi:1,2-diacylglycerol 3-beta-glucosyltransferase